MLAKQSAVLEDAVETIYELTADESIREQCKAREKYVREVNTVLSERDMAIQARNEMRQERDEMRQERDAAIQKAVQQAQEIDQLLKEIGRLKNSDN